MRSVRSCWRNFRLFACTVFATACLVVGAHAQESRLGVVEFPTSARSQEAQARFVRGVAALHSFWYPEALEEFRAAIRIEPGFAMGYWGEAMAHNHPVWGDSQDTDAAREVVARLPSASAVTPRERAYLDAVKALYGEGEKPARDGAYAAAMEKVHRDYPDDLEAGTFHALALLGLAYGRGSHDAAAPRDATALRTRMRAAAIAQEVFRREPNHPGAAHYILHAFDDPDHAILALPAARRYAGIAPAAPHALHMPSHIFLQLGMWPEAVAANEAAWQASLSERVPDFHSLHWLLYTLLQQDRESDARPLLATMRNSLAKVPQDDRRNQGHGAYLQAVMSATYLVETEQWAEAATLLPQQNSHAGSQQGSGSYAALAALAQSPAVFARGLAAAITGSGEVQGAIATLEEVRRQIAGAQVPFAANMGPVLEIQALEIAAAASAGRGRFDEAIATMRHATALEQAMPVPPGPPPVIKPSHELMGAILLRAGRHEEAKQAFATSLFRHPERARSLKGAEQAAGQSMR
jgi:tetratricopeptide (TPR) repeat protein